MGFFNKLFGKKEVVKKEKEEKEEKDKIEFEKKDETKKIELIEKSSIEFSIENERKEEIISKKRNNLFENLKNKLSNSRNGFFGVIKNFFVGRTIINQEMYEELEELLVQSDIGLGMTTKIITTLEEKIKLNKVKNPEEVFPLLKGVMEEFLITEGTSIILNEKEINVILIVGVNGVGKTTTIGKMASKYTSMGKKVVIGAADTFRAAAVEQVEEWAKRAGAEIIKSNKDGGDPGAVVYDTLKRAEEIEADVVIIDTAGRLHNKNNLMDELSKINNIIKRKIGDRFYETILVIDGTTGQNGLAQAKVFNEVTKLTGFIVTKLDGTAKGGVLFSISEELKKPIKYIGIGEKIEDLREFNVQEYIKAIFD
ncbi:MAG: signal recognition particle-docking protein FtsY [Fusobacteriaceae bacterium]